MLGKRNDAVIADNIIEQLKGRQPRVVVLMLSATEMPGASPPPIHSYILTYIYLLLIILIFETQALFSKGSSKASFKKTSK